MENQGKKERGEMRRYTVILIAGIVLFSVFASFAETDVEKSKVDSLIAVLQDMDVRVKAAESLGECDDTCGTNALVNALADRDENVRFAAVVSLGRIGDSRAVDPLVAILRDARLSPVVFSFASYGLPIAVPCSTYVPTLDEDSVASDADIQGAAEWALESIGKDAVEPLIEVLKDESANVRYLALCTLRDIPDARVYEPMIEMLRDEDEYIRANAAQVLGYMGNKKAIKALKGLLEDEVDLVKRAAEEAIKELEKKE
jgi:HEAT repeat protein